MWQRSIVKLAAVVFSVCLRASMPLGMAHYNTFLFFNDSGKKVVSHFFHGMVIACFESADGSAENF